jgi:threonine dehydratase
VESGRARPDTDTCGTRADGLAKRTPDSQNVLTARPFVDDVMLVSEHQMLHAINHLYKEVGFLPNS